MRGSLGWNTLLAQLRQLHLKGLILLPRLRQLVYELLDTLLIHGELLLQNPVPLLNAPQLPLSP